MFGGKKSTGSKPIKGNISDNQIHLILNIPKSTLRDWKDSYGYRRNLYWLLKTMSKEQLEQLSSDSRVFFR